MYVKKIEYYNFRNIDRAKIEPSESVTLLYGKNAEGKTNALEGIYLFAHGRSFRASKEKELVKFGSDFARVKLTFDDMRRENTLEIRIASDGRRVLIRNGAPERRLSDFVGCFRAVLFCPQHLSIVCQGPSERRQFVDAALTQLSSGYVRALQKYNSQLSERNMLIKSYYDNPKGFEDTIDIWSDALAESGAVVARQRYEYVERLNVEVKKIFAEMTDGREVPELKYTAPLTADGYREALKLSREREIKARTTLFGPHRDDIAITINSREARLYASQGQQRSLALAMKLAEGEISKNECGEYPVFLFDDVMSELDETRRAFLIRGMAQKQVIMTSCDRLDGDYKAIEVCGGTYN